MDQKHIDEVWTMLDRPALAAITRSGPEPIFATIGGPHLYGFSSPDSDVDLRGAFLLPAAELLGLRTPRETVTVEEVRDGVELDWVAHDLRKFARMMVRHNGYVMEQLYSPLVVVSGPEHEELMALGRGCITRGTVRHYRGFARGRRLRLAEPGATVKHLLYAYRVYLSGIHLMQTGEVESNLKSLDERFRLAPLQELVRRKREGQEKMPLSDGEVALHEPLLDGLEQRLVQAHEQSELPEEPTTAGELEAFVVRVRLARAGR